MNEKRKILILGGGFGGIKAALELSRVSDFHITLVSDRDDFRYYPTLYHAATGGRTAASSIALKEVFAGKPVRVVKDSVKTIDRRANKVLGSSGANYSYDTLIIALGVVTNFFGIKGLEKYAYGIKSLDEAQRLRRHLHKLLMDEGKPDLNYVVIGGGPTGVELAGALPGYLKHIMEKHKVSKRSLNVELVEASPRLLPRMSKAYSRAVAKRLKRLGVKLYLDQMVQAETADSLVVSGRPINSHTVVWTAGVTNHPFFRANEFKLTDHGKVAVDHQLAAEDNIYVIGDNADTPYSGLAQTALYDATFIANNLKRLLRGKKILAYQPKKPIYVIPVGERWAAVQWGKMAFYGWRGWLLRSAADFVGYHDYEPWWLASRHWVAENVAAEEDCPLCAKA